MSKHIIRVGEMPPQEWLRRAASEAITLAELKNASNNSLISNWTPDEESFDAEEDFNGEEEYANGKAQLSSAIQSGSLGTLGNNKIIKITLDNRGGAGAAGVDLIINSNDQSGGVPIFGASQYSGAGSAELLNIFQSLSGVRAANNARPTLSSTPLGYGELLNTVGNAPIRVHGLKMVYNADTDAINRRQQSQPFIISEKQITGSQNSQMMFPDQFVSALQFQNNIIQMDDFKATIGAKTVIRIGLVAGAVLDMIFTVAATIDNANILDGKPSVRVNTGKLLGSKKR